jgi:hypothetical protein
VVLLQRFVTMHGHMNVKKVTLGGNIAATLLCVQYNRTEAGTPVLQQHSAVLPVPERETVGTTFITRQEQKQLANRA